MGNGLVRISAGMVGILLNSCSPRENSNDLRLSLEVCLEGTMNESSNEPRRGRLRIVDGRHGAETVQGALSYEFRTGLDVNKEVNGNP
jgi:hypothetical protein